MEIGIVRPVLIEEEMKGAYLDYAMSVITARALPDVRDGLKPVQRRILYAMDELGLRHTAAYKKSARIVGECFVAGTRVLTERGLVPIERVERGDWVFTQPGQAPVTELFEMPERDLLRITLENGVAVTVTPSQPLKVLTPQLSYVWKEARELGPEDHVVLRASYPQQLSPVRLPDWNGSALVMDERVAYLLGLFLSDGWFDAHSGRFFFYSTSPAIIHRAGECLEASFDYHAHVENLRYRVQLASGAEQERSAYQIRVNATELNQYLATIFGVSGETKAATKRIPEAIFQSPSSVIAAMISGVLDGDGSVHVGRNVVQYGTISSAIADDLQVLLLHLGVLTRRFEAAPDAGQPCRVDGRVVLRSQPFISLEAAGRYALRLGELLNCAHEMKRERLHRILVGRRKQVKYDQIPNAGRTVFGELSRQHLGGGWYQDVDGRKFQSGIRYPGGAKIRYGTDLREKDLGRTQVDEWGIAAKLERVGSHHAAFFKDVLAHDIYFLRVAQVEPAPAEKSYDLQVAGPHEFVANGIVAHNCLGKYHPHGDAPVYESMVRLAQDFSMRYPLVDGQGNFGSIDGDPAAAMRYTEARLTAIAEEMLADIDKSTVDFAGNFDDTLKEPKVLPAKLPNLLVNGSAGIAVGMATNIPPHNVGEVIDALTYIISRFGAALDAGVPFALVWGRAFNAPVDLAVATPGLNALDPALKQRVQAAAARLARRPDGEQRVQALLDIVDDMIDVPPDKLMEMVKGPDFPTAGIILGGEGIKNAYATGHGRVTIRARAHTEDMRGGRTQLVVTELPFQVNKAALLEKIAELVRERRIEGISELRDESDRQGMRVVIELRREAQPRHILNQLYKYTAMQTTFSVNMLALVDGQPRVLTLKMVLLHYLNHRREVLTRRTAFELERARQRAHILQGLKIALDHLDEVIATIRRSKDAETARTALMKNFKLSELQAQAILDMQLRRLAALERQKILDEYAETLKLIARLEDLLAHPVKILYLIRDELLELKTKYGDGRRTQIRAEEAVDFSEEDLVPDQEVVVTISGKAYVRRVLADSFRLQRRGSKGIVGTLSKEDDPPLQLVLAGTRDSLLLFSNRGRAYQMKVYDVPDVTRQARGLPLGNFISLDEQERVVVALPLSKLEGRHIVLATRRGEVKRVAVSEYAAARAAGIIGAAVPENDELVGAVATSGQQEIVLVTAEGQAIRFAEGDLRPSGRNSGGVRGVRLGDRDRVVAIDVARSGAHLVVATRRGFAKRTPLAELSTQGRGGGGVRAATVSLKNGELVAGVVAGEGDEVVLVTAGGTLLRCAVSGLPAMARAAQGAPIVSLDRDDKVLAAAVVSAREKSPADGKAAGAKGEPQAASNGVEQEAVPGGELAGAVGVTSAKRGGTKSGAKVSPAGRSAPARAKSAGAEPVKQAALPAKGAVAVAEPAAPPGGDRSGAEGPGTGAVGGAIVRGKKAAKGATKPAGSPPGRAKTAQRAHPAKGAKSAAAAPSSGKSTSVAGAAAAKARPPAAAPATKKAAAATKPPVPATKKAATAAVAPPATGQRAVKGKDAPDDGAPGEPPAQPNWRPLPPATPTQTAPAEATAPRVAKRSAAPRSAGDTTPKGERPAGRPVASDQTPPTKARAAGDRTLSKQTGVESPPKTGGSVRGKRTAKEAKPATLFGSIAATLAGSVKGAQTKQAKGKPTATTGEQEPSKKGKRPARPKQPGLPL